MSSLGECSSFVAIIEHFYSRKYTEYDAAWNSYDATLRIAVIHKADL